MRISMIVHNSVLRDPRVTKEAVTLRQAGHDVEVHGIGESASVSTFLPGTDIPMYLVPRARLPRPPTPAVVRRTLKFTIVVLAILGAFGLGYGFRVWLPVDSPVQSIMDALPPLAVLLLALYTLRKKCMRMVGVFVDGMVRAAVRMILKTRSGAVIVRKHYQTISVALLQSVALRRSPDVVHIHDHIGLLCAKEIKERYSCKIVWDAHEIYDDLAYAEKARHRVNRSLIQENMQFVDRFITINNSFVEYYRKNYQSLPRATVLMNASKPTPLLSDDGRLRRAAGLADGQMILLYQGGLSPKRGLHHLVKAAPRLKSNWTVVMMGWGPLEAELRALAESHKRDSTNPAIVFIPPAAHDELPQWTVGAQLGIIPYENSGTNHLYCTPNKIWELPNAGVPILATDLVELGRIVKEHNLGFLLPRNFGVPDICEAINGITEEQLETARVSCRKFAAVHNWDRFAPRLIELYEDIQTTSVNGIGDDQQASS